jgi:predicted DNA-binding transcriptional regulator YafY
VTVRLRFAPPGADSAVAELGQAVMQVVPDGEAREVMLEATFLDGLLPTLLSHRGRAQVLEPAELRDKVRSAFARLAGEG